MPLPESWTLLDVLALVLSQRVKTTSVRRIVERYTSLDEAIRRHDDDLLKAGVIPSQFHSTEAIATLRDAAEVQMETCRRNAITLCTLWDDCYPHNLREIYYPPAVLFVRGTLQPPDAIAIAVVGTRRCTDYGRLTAERFAERFAQRHALVVSGLAHGIDTAAHKGALRAGGLTYAVIASGIDKITPATAHKLAATISAEGGAIVSEYPCGMGALRSFFPQRNRIISGISMATIVVESGTKGGALITAKFALDQNRELFAVPGPITSERSAGTNALIKRSQAMLAQSPEDVLESLGAFMQLERPNSAQSDMSRLSDTERAIVAQLQYEPLHIDLLADKCALPTRQLLAPLLELEFKGIIRQLPGKQFVRADYTNFV